MTYVVAFRYLVRPFHPVISSQDEQVTLFCIQMIQLEIDYTMNRSSPIERRLSPLPSPPPPPPPAPLPSLGSRLAREIKAGTLLSLLSLPLSMLLYPGPSRPRSPDREN